MLLHKTDMLTTKYISRLLVVDYLENPHIPSEISNTTNVHDSYCGDYVIIQSWLIAKKLW